MIIIDFPTAIKVLPNHEASGFVVNIPFASTDDNNTITVVICALNNISIDGEPYHEFSFSAAVHWMDGSHETLRTQDRREVARHIPKGGQRRAMEAICLGLSALLDQVVPPRVYGVTWEKDPTEKCLRKYQLLIELGKARGYEILDQGTDAAGKRYWKMGR